MSNEILFKLKMGLEPLMDKANEVKLSLDAQAEALLQTMADDDNALAEGDNFEQFTAHDKAVTTVSASLQAARERLVEAVAHITEARTTYARYVHNVMQKQAQGAKDTNDEN